MTGGVELSADFSSGTLDAVTLAGTLRIGYLLNNVVEVRNGLTLDGGSVAIESNGALNFLGTQTLGGSGEVHFVDSDARKGLFATTAGTVLTIGSGIAIHGVSGSVGRADGGAVSLQGEIASNGGGTITVHNASNYAVGTSDRGRLEGGSQQHFANCGCRYRHQCGDHRYRGCLLSRVQRRVRTRRTPWPIFR